MFKSKNLTDWETLDALTMHPITSSELLEFNPIKHKLFSGDMFTYNAAEDAVTIVYSTIRSLSHIPGVLILNNDKTYGKEKGKTLFKCVPDDRRLPAFLVPYEIKHIGFSKVNVNLYVIFRFNNWDAKHPRGTLSNTLGPINVLDNFYEYQLYCKSLNASIQQFNKTTIQALNGYNFKDYDTIIDSICLKKSIQDRTHIPVMSIDPADCRDFDDAFSVQKRGEDTLVSIYIANVTILLDELNLWTSFTNRIATIYLPDRKRPMLPTILSDCLCSLQSGKRRFAFAMDICLDEQYNVKEITYTNCTVCLTKNYTYEESELVRNSDYLLLRKIVTGLNNSHRHLRQIKDSHDVVCYLMIFMNHHCAMNLLQYNNGIFRSAIVQDSQAGTVYPDSLPDNVLTFIKMWNNTCSQYLDITKNQITRHDVLELNAYTHITSPIRRLVDLLNILRFQKNHSLVQLSAQADEFYDNWINEMDYINTTMRSIKKIQTECSLLNMCTNDEQTMSRLYEGYWVDKSLNKLNH